MKIPSVNVTQVLKLEFNSGETYYFKDLNSLNVFLMETFSDTTQFIEQGWSVSLMNVIMSVITDESPVTNNTTLTTTESPVVPLYNDNTTLNITYNN